MKVRGWSRALPLLLLLALLLPLFLPAPIPEANAQSYYLKVYFGSAVINGVTLSASNPEIAVQPGAVLEGYFEARVENVQPGSWITPVIGTASWTRRQFSCIANSAPTGTSNQRYTFSITAPNTPGTYYIGIFAGWMYTCDEVASNDHPPNYDDGDDVWDMPGQGWEEVISNGQASTGPYRMPGRAIRIVVQQQQQLNVDVWTNKGGQGIGNLGGGQYSIGESVTLFCSVNINVDSLRVRVIRPDGAELTALERGPSPAGTYQASGTAGEPVGERRVICEARSGGQSSSDEVRFTVVSPSDTTPPTVRVIAPNGGERLTPGSVFRIRWEASDNVGVTGVYIRLYQGGVMRVIIADNPPNSGYYDWTVPDRPGSGYKIVVIARDAAGNFGEDESDGTFEIVAVAQGTLQHFDLDYRGTPPNSDGNDQTMITVSPCSSLTLFFYYREGNTGNPYIVRVYPEWDKDRFIANSDNNEAAPEGERGREEGGFRWDVETYIVPCTPGTYKVRVVYRGSHTPPTWDSYDRLLAEGTVIVQAAATAILQVGIRHTFIGDLKIWVGVEGGREVLIWNREGGSADDIFREWNLLQLGFTTNDLPPSESKRWYLKISDEVDWDEGRLEYFRIVYQGQTYESQDHPEIKDRKTVWAWIPSSAQPPAEWETLLTVRVPGTDNTEVVYQVRKLGANKAGQEQLFKFSIEVRDVNGQAPRDESPFIRGGKLYVCYDRRTGPDVYLPTRWVPIPPNTEFSWYYTQYKRWGRVLLDEYRNAVNERGYRDVAQNVAVNAFFSLISMGMDNLLQLFPDFWGWLKSFAEDLLDIFGIGLEQQYEDPSYPDSFKSIILNRNKYVCQEVVIMVKPRYRVGFGLAGVTGWSAEYIFIFPHSGDQELITWFYLQYDRVLRPDAYIKPLREERIVINISR
jgi:subtilisin-like proprotein convertase family protein